MINNANKHTLSEIFSIDVPVKYVIPRFQREFTWNKENWEELLNDIEESDGGHFIGSIICIPIGTADTLNPALELVDGQQRLTTISLLYSAIYEHLKNKHNEDDEDSRQELGNLKWRLAKKHSGTETKIELSRQNHNSDDYRSILGEMSIIEQEDVPRNRGNRRIYKTYKYFITRLEGYSVREISDLLAKINNTLLVKIEVDSHSDAFILFESLNNRGIPLTPIDLIKNKILAEVDGRQVMTVDEAFNRWTRIIQHLDDYPIQERFLRQFYNAFKHKDEIKVEGATKATRSNLIKIYDTLIERDPLSIFNHLTEKAAIYHGLVAPSDTDTGDINGRFGEFKYELTDLFNVKAAPAYTFLLFLFSQRDNLALEDDFYKRIISILVKYFARRNITDFPNTRNLDQIFIDLVEELAVDSAKINYGFISSFLTDKSRFSSRHTFEDKLNEDLYELNVDATRFLLSKIEETRGTRENRKDFWERDNSNKLAWTVEHIFPEGRNIPDAWIQMIAEGDTERARQIQDELVHKLGNLTLTRYNQSLSNSDFAEKRDRKDSRDNPIGYKNGLFLNEDLVDKNTWNGKDIKERTSKLVKLALDIFDIEGR